jgi:hypothetical protein
MAVKCNFAVMTDVSFRALQHKPLKCPFARSPLHGCLNRECATWRTWARAHATAIEGTAKVDFEVLTLPPNALTLEPGELSPVVRHPSDSPHDIFRCSGCTDAACQVSPRNPLSP